MGVETDFAVRFRLVLHALGLSRGRAAVELKVDKSLVGRWAAGAVKPSDNNLANITSLVARRIAGFNMVDWERDFEGFAARIGLDPSVASSLQQGEALHGVPLPFLDLARAETQRRRSAYEGFWRTTRPSVMMQGRVAQDHGMIRATSNGLLEVRMGGAGLVFTGWAFLSEGNLFAILHDAVGYTPMFLIFRGVTLPKATVLDGLLMLASLDAARTPAAIPIILERIGDLTGDREADDRTCADLSAREALAHMEEMPETVLGHLFRDFGPSSTAAGGSMFLTTAASGGFSRGSSPSGELQG